MHTWSRPRCFRLVIPSVCALFLLVLLFYTSSQRLTWLALPVQKGGTNATPLVLMWSILVDRPLFLRGDLVGHLASCGCRYTESRELFQEAAAVIFHWRNVKDLPPYKPRGQKWALINHESPLHVHLEELTPIATQVDWVVSYPRESDIWSPYGRFRPRRTSDPPYAPSDLTVRDFHRKLPAAWLVSNCRSDSGREELVRGLQRHLRVDVYGKCAEQFGGRDATWLNTNAARLQAYQALAQRYKFYLAFENSLCTDYVTEKAFLPLQVGMVPVVLGGADYQQFLPPGSFVQVAEYDSVRLLAMQLKTLARNYTLYKRYLDWRHDYVIEYATLTDRPLCALCERLFSQKKIKRQTIIRDIRTVWNATRDCWRNVHFL